MRSEHLRLLLPVYVPTLLLAFGQGVMIPVLPIYAKNLGGSFGLAGLVVSAAWIGTMLSDLPAGMYLPRLGYRRSMIVGCGLFAVATAALGLVQIVPFLILFRLISGVGSAFWGISRHAYIADVVPAAGRGRAIAVFGGINRFGTFSGPAVGGLISKEFGIPTALIVAGVLAGLALLVAIAFVHDPETHGQRRERSLHFGILREAVAGNQRDVAAAGTAQIFGQMIRAGRQIVVPLFASFALGLDDFQVGQIVSASSMVDMLLFIPAGIIMDRFGRKAAAVPSFAILAAGMALVPFTTSYWTLFAAVMVMGFGNGIGSGTMMTLGADLAPPGRLGEFLGIWRLIGDSGQAIAPLAIGAIADGIGLYMTAGIVSGLGVISATTMAAFVRETRWKREPKVAASPPVRRV